MGIGETAQQHSPFHWHNSLQRLVLGCAIAMLSLLTAARAQACLGASQNIRVLLGETKEGLVWAALELTRKEDDEDERFFWWRLRGHVELVPHEGTGTRVLPSVRAISAAFKSRQGRSAHYEPPINKYLDSLADRINLPGFRRPKGLRQHTCDYARACGPWRLRVEGRALVAEGGEDLRTVVAIPKKFAQKADLEGSADAKTMAWLRKGLRLMKITEYQLEDAKAFVLNLAMGDYHSTYGEDEPPVTKEPAPMHLTRECQGVACYHPAMTMHHGNHLEVSIVSPSAR